MFGLLKCCTFVSSAANQKKNKKIQKRDYDFSIGGTYDQTTKLINKSQLN